jgi:hypothetical protein
MSSSLCLLKILSHCVVYHGALGVNMCGVEQRVDGVRCDVFCTTSPHCGVVLSFVPTFLFVLHLARVPVYFRNILFFIRKITET